MIDYNKKYTKEDIGELKQWFEGRELPATMQIDSSAYSSNLKLTVSTLLRQAERFYDNPNLYGCIYLLERIREHLQPDAPGEHAENPSGENSANSDEKQGE